jgi:hypothetical protein
MQTFHCKKGNPIVNFSVENVKSFLTKSLCDNFWIGEYFTWNFEKFCCIYAPVKECLWVSFALTSNYSHPMPSHRPG